MSEECSGGGVGRSADAADLPMVRTSLLVYHSRLAQPCLGLPVSTRLGKPAVVHRKQRFWILAFPYTLTQFCHISANIFQTRLDSGSFVGYNTCGGRKRRNVIDAEKNRSDRGHHVPPY